MSKLNEDFPGHDQLVAGGYTTITKVRNASDEELLAVDGVGPVTVEKIRAALAEPETAAETTAAEPTETAAVEAHICNNPLCGYEIAESPCPYCGTV